MSKESSHQGARRKVTTSVMITKIDGDYGD